MNQRPEYEGWTEAELEAWARLTPEVLADALLDALRSDAELYGLLTAAVIPLPEDRRRKPESSDG